MLSTILFSLLWLAALLAVGLTLAYKRVDLRTATIVLGFSLLAYNLFGASHWLWMLLLWLGFAGLVTLNLANFRREKISAPLLKIYRSILPPISATEREALEAGSVWWDGELFSGQPDWSKLTSLPAAKLTAEEQAFLDGPTEELCRIIDDWQITHVLADIQPEVWAFIKENRFFAMIIPKEYGGLEFSPLAVAAVLSKLASRSVVVASTVGVPNSLGPAELLLHYGTQEQRDRYLPGLASGEEIPCFALTGPRVGSDASTLPDTGIVCKGTVNGEEIIGIRLNWDKRYITLAPIATVLGLAFKLYDPEHLVGDRDEYGITAALIPTDTEGVEIGRRHLPLNIPFQNGPTRGKDVFVPLDSIIGGMEQAGQGWRMLVEQLAAGRSIVLPANSSGGAQAAVYGSGAYTRIRKQFKVSVSRFEGVGEALARMAARTYIINAAVAVTCTAIGRGEKPAVPSAILKYHCTELGRKIANDAMDVQGGKGIVLGPKNYLGRGYQAVPIGITVEGANILTRSLIIYGQGAIRCHPIAVQSYRLCHRQHGALVRARHDPCEIQLGTAIRAGGAILSACQSLQRRVRAGFRLCHAGPGRGSETTREFVGPPRRCVQFDVPGQHGAEAFCRSGATGRRSAARRMGLSLPAVPGTGATTQLPAQFPEQISCRQPARADFSARAHVLGAGR